MSRKGGWNKTGLEIEMADTLSWAASIATMIGAMMTAANLGPRFTGWGFVSFVIGSICWTAVGFSSGQPSLLWSNIFLTLVNIAGVWRWLGQRARYDDGARAAAEASAAHPAPTLFSLASLDGMPVAGPAGEVIAHVVDGMARCDNGRISYLIVREGGVAGVGERLHAMTWNELRLEDGVMATGLSIEKLQERKQIAPAEWPVRVPQV